MKRIVLLIFLLVPVARADAWRSDWKEAFQIATQQHRMVFVDYFATWCEPCQIMDKNVFSKADVQQQLSDYVQLRIDVDRSTIGRFRKVEALPTYVIYDFDQREVLRIEGAKPIEIFSPVLDQMRAVVPSFIRVAELFDLHRDVEASVLLGNTYTKIQLFDKARVAYDQARKIAAKSKDAEAAQKAEVLSAFTFAREGNAGRAITILQRLLMHPASREVEAFIYLTMGNAYRLSKDSRSARESYEQARSIAAPDSPIYRNATAALNENPNLF